MHTELINDAMEYIRMLFAGNAGGHDAGHTMRVYHNAMMIASSQSDIDMEVTALAALLHDADDHKLFQTENNANAREFLQSHCLDARVIEQIITAINSVSFSRNRGRRPETPEGRIVQDADRLDAIGAVGIARTFAFGGEHGRSLDDTIQHFHDKLLLLKDEMNTDAAKEMAEKRHDFMVRFLSEYDQETGA